MKLRDWILASAIAATLTVAGDFTAPLSAQSGLTTTCVDGTLGNGNCYPGHVRFTGSGFPSLVHVLVKRGDGAVYDDFDYTAVDFTETLYPAASYTVVITDPATGASLASASITTGGE